MYNIKDNLKSLENKIINDWNLKNDDYDFDVLNYSEMDRYCDNNNVSSQSLLEDLMNHNKPIKFFLKKQSRRNLGEKILKNHLIINGYMLEKDIIILPKRGKKSAHLCGNEILFGKKEDLKDKISLGTHSLDMQINHINHKIFLFHKTINGNGGTQGTQFDETLHFLNYANQIKMKNVLVGACVLGDYFTEQKMLELSNVINTQHVFIKTPNNFLEFLNEII